MLFTHFKSAWRNLLRHPFSSTINIIGLATGITCCIFISIYVWNELQADEFHVNRKNLFRVNMISPESERAGNAVPYPFGTSLQNEYHEISKIVRLGQDNVSIRAGQDSYFYEDQFYWADSTFFDVLTFPLVKGNEATALKDPYSLVMTESMAKKYFKEEDPIGKEVEMKIYDGDRKFSFTVTGVVKDLPKNSTIRFGFIAPMRTALQVYPQFENFWNLSWVTTYAMVDHPATIKEKEKQAAVFFEKYAGKGFAKLGIEFQPMSRLHLYSGHVGKNLSDSITNVYLFIIIGIFIFLLACVNFVNLSTARAELRKKEIGVRKALGAFRKQLFAQFMTEALLTAAIVLVIAFAATSALQPLASEYVDGTSVLFSAFVLPLVFLGAMILIGLFAGLYPAAYLSSFQPLEALKGKVEKMTSSVFSPRQVLVVFQFTISIALIAGTLIINKQVRYLKNADLGMATDQLITIPVDDRELQKKMASIRDLMATAPGVAGVAASGEKFPADMNNTWEITWQGRVQEDTRSVDVVSIDDVYFDLLHAEFVEGRNLSRAHGTDSSGFIINEATRSMMGVAEAVGMEVKVGGKPGTIIGVVKDIHHYSLHQKVEPIAYLQVPAPNRACSDNLVVKISSQSLPTTLASLKDKWETLTQDRPFEYHFVDEEFALTYAQEDRFLILFEVFSGLAIVIACLGLMGLSSFVVSKRAKEIGIRKVLGASVPQILMMLTRGFSVPIVIAFLIAGPGVYYIMKGWLDKFAYKVEVDFFLLMVSGVLAWLVAFSFIGLQSWKAARMNPVTTLKDE
jgi:putative ABC transport system permease protein